MFFFFLQRSEAYFFGVKLMFVGVVNFSQVQKIRFVGVKIFWSCSNPNFGHLHWSCKLASFLFFYQTKSLFCQNSTNPRHVRDVLQKIQIKFHKCHSTETCKVLLNRQTHCKKCKHVAIVFFISISVKLSMAWPDSFVTFRRHVAIVASALRKCASLGLL